MTTIEIIVLGILALALLVALIEFVKFEIWYHDHRKQFF